MGVVEGRRDVEARAEKEGEELKITREDVVLMEVVVDFKTIDASDIFVRSAVVVVLDGLLASRKAVAASFVVVLCRTVDDSTGEEKEDVTVAGPLVLRASSFRGGEEL